MHTLASYSGTETNEVYMRIDDTLYKHAQSDPNLVAYVQEHGFLRSPGSTDFEVLCPGVLQNLVWDTTWGTTPHGTQHHMEHNTTWNTTPHGTPHHMSRVSLSHKNIILPTMT
jgi:hypothetical protein